MGYFKEGVTESRLENFRIRKLIVCYYLEDNTIQISEPKQVNSGTPQGAFLKRQMILNSDGSQSPLLPQDFQVGTNVNVYGRNINIYDADTYTREFFNVRYTP